MNICIFCSANSNLPTEYFDRTRELGAWMGANGHTLVFGGCNLGLMECVAEAVHNAKGMTIGVVPSIVEKGGKVSEHVDVKILCDNLSDRKDLMIQRSDVIIALPGGVGTLDEIFTVLAAASIGYTTSASFSTTSTASGTRSSPCSTTLRRTECCVRASTTR